MKQKTLIAIRCTALLLLLPVAFIRAGLNSKLGKEFKLWTLFAPLVFLGIRFWWAWAMQLNRAAF